MSTPEPKKQAIETFTVDYWKPDGTLLRTDEVRPVPFMGTDGRAGQAEMIAIQEKILEYVVFETAAIGAMAIDPNGLDLLRKAAAMLWVMGKSETERGIDLINLLNNGDYLQIGRIFVSKSYCSDEIITPFEQPSQIAQIHKMNFWGKLYGVQEEKAKQGQAVAIDNLEKQVVVTVPTPTPTPVVEVLKIDMPRLAAVAGT